jgi:hypothetical protein
MRDVICSHCNEETTETDRRTERLSKAERWAHACPECAAAPGAPCNTTVHAVARAGYVHDARPVDAFPGHWSADAGVAGQKQHGSMTPEEGK